MFSICAIEESAYPWPVLLQDAIDVPVDFGDGGESIAISLARFHFEFAGSTFKKSQDSLKQTYRYHRPRVACFLDECVFLRNIPI